MSILRYAAFLLLSVAVLACPQQASADLIVDLLDGVIAPDGTVTVDVLLSGDGVIEQLSDYSLMLNIAPVSATAGTRLEYVDPQSEAFLE